MELGGLDELDTQIKLFHLGIESFSPYANQSKVDMIIRSEVDEIVRYADVKVCTGVHEEDQIVWKLEFPFFLKNESFLVLSVRLPEKDEKMEKHHLIVESKTFLKIVKREKIPMVDSNWVLSIPFSDLQQLTKKKRPKKLPKLVNAFKPFFDNWQKFVDWKENPTKPKSKPKAKPKAKPTSD